MLSTYNAANGADYERDLGPSPATADVCADYLEAERDRWAPKTIACYKAASKHITRLLGSVPIAELRARDVYRAHRSMRDTPRTANLLLGLLRAVCDWAEVMEWRPEGSNPCRAVRKHKETKRSSVLTEPQLRRILAALTWLEASYNSRGTGGGVSPAMAGAFRVMLFTGMRRGEVLAMRVRELDLAQKCVRIDLDRVKVRDKQAAVRPLSDHAIAVLDRRVETVGGHPDAHLFPGRRAGRPIVEPSKAWARVLEAADVDHVPLHTLRHSFATAAIMTGVPRERISAMLGHTSVFTVDKYAHAQGGRHVAEANRTCVQITSANNTNRRMEVS